jgi:hypothetical protein
MDQRTRLRVLRKAHYSCTACGARTAIVRDDGLVVCADHTNVCCGRSPYCNHATT